jgi:hypothetical protein
LPEQIWVDGAGDLITLPGTANDPIAGAGGTLTPLGPSAAMLGTVNQGNGSPKLFGDAREWGGALDGALRPILGVLEAELALDLVKGDFQRPASGEGLDDVARRQLGVGRHAG